MTAMSVHEAVKHIRTREDFVAFVRALRCDLEDDPSAWENGDLGSYLDAVAAWVEDMDGYLDHAGKKRVHQPSWKLLGEILMAARVYE
jgi:hypothetical protein